MADERGDEQVEGRDGTPVGRRAVLGLLGLGAVGIAFGSGAESWLSKQVGKVSAKDPTGLTGLVPGGGGFRIYTVTAGYPGKSRSDYRLKVSGLVDRPLTLTYDDLLALPQTQLTKDFQCVTGWRVQDVEWQGVRLADLLDHVGASTGAAYLHFRSFDGTYTESLTMEQARRPDVLVANHMLGKEVTREHGGPVRLYVAPMYGYKSIKWLDGIEVTDELKPGFWEKLGYDVDAWIGQSNGRDDEPV
jgi:DMSO/TMAO reductase YedYZ molybdopterin-dependent catalytic subunit